MIFQHKKGNSMRDNGLRILISVVISLVPSLVQAHGVTGDVGSGGVVVSARYNTGEAMSYAKVRIAAPGTDIPFQSGRTDRNGRFCFFPDTQGDWRVVVDDEMGHRLQVTVPVDEGGLLKKGEGAAPVVKSMLSRYENALIGISLIFGLSGLFFWWKAKKTSRKIKGGGR
jgi:nickel transport protein